MLDPHQSKEELEKLLSVLEEENRVKAYLVIFHKRMRPCERSTVRIYSRFLCTKFRIPFSPSSLCFVFIHDALELIN